VEIFEYIFHSLIIWMVYKKHVIYVTVHETSFITKLSSMSSKKNPIQSVSFKKRRKAHPRAQKKLALNVISTSRDSILNYSNLSNSQNIVINSDTIQANIQEITINYDCDIYFPSKTRFNPFRFTISNCSVFIRNFNFSGTLVVENSSVVFQGCTFSNENFKSIRSSSFCQISFLDCQIENNSKSSFTFQNFSNILIKDSTFLQCGCGVSCGLNSRISVLNCKFENIHDHPLLILENSAIFIHETRYFNCKRSVLIHQNSKIDISNCIFQQFESHALEILPNCFITIHDSIFSKCKLAIIISDNSKIFLSGCNFEHIQTHPVQNWNNCTVFIQRSTFSNCEINVSISHCSNVFISNCKFHQLHRLTLGIHLNSVILIQETRFFDCDYFLLTGDNSTIDI
jgi:hypothetical protein